MSGDKDSTEAQHGLVQRKNLTLVIANLGWGGAQKVIAQIANDFARRGWKVSIISIDEAPSDVYFRTDPAVRLVYLGISGKSPTAFRALVKNMLRLWTIRTTIREAEPAVVISFLTGTNIRTLIATAGLRIPVIVSERGDPARPGQPRAWLLLRWLTYPMAFRLAAQTEAALAHFSSAVRRRGIVVPNPIEIPPQLDAVRPQTVVAVGHLAPVKGFDLLLDAFAACIERHPEWSLVLWGEGPQRAELEAQCRRLGIADRVSLPGRTDQPGEWVRGTGIFVLASRHEGFPNALAEAMAAGLPVIASDCPSGGPRALISDQRNGRLVPKEDPEALASALHELLSDAELRERLGTAARASMQRYAAPDVLARWHEVVEEALASAHTGVAYAPAAGNIKTAAARGGADE